jgi:nucleoside-diphosphate-sugar epimerase
VKVLVTGGAGYIGSTLVPLLLARGHSVTVLDLLPAGIAPLLSCFRESRFSLVRADIRDERAVRDAAAGADAIVHLAAVSGAPACDRDPERAVEVNERGTLIVARAAGRRTLVYASTGSCYGAVPGGRCDEATEPRPISRYGSTKLAGERAVLDAHGGIVLRFATAYGVSPRMRVDLLVNHFVRVLLAVGEIAVYEPHARRTFIHVADAARGLLLSLENAGRMTGEVYNAGSDEQNRTKGEVLGIIQARIPGSVVRADPSGADPDRRDYTVSYRKIREAGFHTTVSLEEGVDELVRALRWWQEGSP